jgi:aspartate ammonia-lyase
MNVFRTRCIDGVRADEARCRELLDRSTALATALSPYIGYAATADIAKTSVATGTPVRELVRARGLIPEDQLDAILSAEAMTSPGIPGQTAGQPAKTRAPQNASRISKGGRTKAKGRKP